jgi:hypothetical protein
VIDETPLSLRTHPLSQVVLTSSKRNTDFLGKAV